MQLQTNKTINYNKNNIKKQKIENEYSYRCVSFFKETKDNDINTARAIFIDYSFDNDKFYDSKKTNEII